MQRKKFFKQGKRMEKQESKNTEKNEVIALDKNLKKQNLR